MTDENTAQGGAPRAFIIGHPVRHSRSPLIHGFWLAEHGLPGSYERMDVAPADLPAVLERLREGAFAGGNVTVPHKEAVFRACGRVTDVARQLGAVNTLYRGPEGDWVGDNTDAQGFERSLAETLGEGRAPGSGTRCLVLGAGGAARATLGALRARGAGTILVANRSRARAEALAGEGAFDRLEVIGWDDVPDALGSVSLLVNTTSCGMNGRDPLRLPLHRMAPGGAVADLVYVPLETELLATARAAGLDVVDGLGMLLHQAVPGFEAWFGVRPRVTAALRARIVADLEGGA